MATKIRRVFDTHAYRPEKAFDRAVMSGMILRISIFLIVLLGIINPENYISFYISFIFNDILYNVLMLPSKLISHVLVSLSGRIK